MADLEIVLAVILTVLALAILTILIARWSRRRNNGARVSRYASEQSISHGRHKRGRGKQFRFLCRTGSVINEDTHCVSFPLGSRCSFSSDSELTQKTFLQTPGPIVQCMDSSESCTPEGSNAVIPVDICCQPALKPSCCQQLAIKPSCCQPYPPCLPCKKLKPATHSCSPFSAPPETLPLLITQRASTKRGPPIILKKASDCKGQMVRHGGSVTFQGIGEDQIKCCKEWRRCQCEYCCPKRFESYRREPIWCEEPAPPPSSQQQQQQQQPPPRRQDSQVRGGQRNESEIDAQTICYEEPFLFRRLESLIRRNQDGIVIKQNEDGFLIKKAEEGKQKKKTSKRSSVNQETDSDSSAKQTGEAPPESTAPPEHPEGEEKKRKKDKKKKKKKDG
ncbi:testis-expressed basic protein 1 [Mus pahari]|uniref:testis-expressed basic protein 1 n=1 Tax=Mus pahari TaxID=10093 RepID=UPI000A31401E|nr:testis-expressed basic protein 1 [Mus pahari]